MDESTRRPNQRLVRLLIVLAIAVAVATAVLILRLPEAGSVRYGPTNSHSSLSQLKTSLDSVGLTPAYGVIQTFLLKGGANLLSFKASTTWTAADVESERKNYIAAGGILILSLLVSAFVLGRREDRGEPTHPAPSPAAAPPVPSEPARATRSRSSPNVDI